MSIGNIIRQHRKLRGLTLMQMEAKTGINNGNLSKIETGKQSLTNESMQAIADALGIALSDLFANTNDAPAPTSSGKSFSMPVTFYKTMAAIPAGAMVSIRGISMDRDRQQWQFNEESTHPFFGDSLRHLICQPEHIAALAVQDDTMQPRIFPGDTVVIDTSDIDAPNTGGVFAVSIDGKAIEIRRVFSRPGGTFIISCDNQAYPDITITAENVRYITIIGRVKAMHGTAGF